MRYYYFGCYTCVKNGITTMGSLTFDRPYKFRTSEDLLELSEFVRAEKGADTIVMTNISLLDSENEN